MKYRFSVLLVILMMFVTPLSMNTLARPATHYTTISLNQIQPTPSTNSKLEQTSSSSSPSYFSGDVVIFAHSQQEYQTLVQNPAVVETYKFIQAVKLAPTYQQFKELAKKYQQLLPASLFTQTRQIPIVSSLPNNQAIGLDGSKDVAKIGVNPMWDMGYNGTGVTVGVIDNGVNFTVPALSGAKANSVSIALSGSSSCYSHGTPVTGSIAARPVAGYEDTVGTAPGSKIFALNGGCGSSGSLEIDSLKAWNTIFANNATISVINTSYGGPPNIAYNNFVKKAEELGIIVVGAAGNDGAPRSMTGGPGNTVWGLSVGASTYTDTAAFFTSVGPGYGFNQKPDVIAPGYRVTLVGSPTDGSPGKVIESGTSFASPIVAGGVATLISALKANSINYNVGVLKAAIMRGAQPIVNSPNVEGFGLVNITKSFQIIQQLSAASSDNIPQIVELSPKNGPVGIINTIPQGTKFNATYTLITSHPQDTTITFGGGLAGIAHIAPLQNENSQFLKIEIDTSSLSPNSLLSGTITATDGSDSVTANLKLNIGGPVKGKVLFDTRHTYWNVIEADQLDGTNTGQMVKLAFANGWVVDQVNKKLTPQLLQKYDMLWMPDPLNARTASDLRLELSAGNVITAENYIHQSEIDAIHQFVHNGGNLFLDFNGILEDSTTNTISANATAVNKLISDFGITAVSTPLATPSQETTIPTVNSTSLVKGIRQITHFGNYLQISGAGAMPFAQDQKNQISGAVYTDPSGGSVLVASTNFWLDNTGATGGYKSHGGGSNDNALATNVWNWFGDQHKIAITSETVKNNGVSGEFVIVNGTTPDTTTTPQVYIKGNSVTPRQDVSIKSLGNGKYSFDLQFNTDGLYNVVVQYGSQYVIFSQVKIDTTGPVFSFIGTDDNGTAYPVSQTYFLSVNITDAIDTLSKQDISISYNGSLLTNIQQAYTPDNGVYKALVPSEAIGTAISNKPYYFHIEATDLSGNTASAVITMYIKGASSTQPDNVSKTKGTPVNTFFVVSALLVMTSVMIERRRLQK